MKYWYSKTDHITKWLYQFDISNRLSKLKEVFLKNFTIFKMCVSGKIHLSFTDNIPHVFNVKGIVPLVRQFQFFGIKSECICTCIDVNICFIIFQYQMANHNFFFVVWEKSTRGQESSPTWITIDVLKSEHYGAIFIALSQIVIDA